MDDKLLCGDATKLILWTNASFRHFHYLAFVMPDFNCTQIDDKLLCRDATKVILWTKTKSFRHRVYSNTRARARTDTHVRKHSSPSQLT